MSKNVGKIFEDDFAKSIPENYCLIHRLKDSAQSYNNSSNTLFSWDNECDFFVFDTNACILYCLELKSTKSKSISYQIDENDKSKKMIKFHQIKSLTKFSNYNNVNSGFVFNFRDEENNTQRTYFMNIKDFNKMRMSNNKKSCDELDIIMNNAIKIHGELKRTHYRWFVDEFLKNMKNK